MKAVLKNGAICPKEPVPTEWAEGTELEVHKVLVRPENGALEMESQFRRLAAQWKADTLVLSDPVKIMGHPAMRAIVALGQDVVPIILRDLGDEPSLMVLALPEITGESLAPPKRGGGFVKWNIAAQIEAWQNWGRAKGLL